MKRPDLLTLVVIWQFVNAFLLFIGIVAISAFALPDTGGGGVVALSFAIFVLVCFLVLSLVGGIGILQAKNWGRIVSMVNAILGLLNIPIGTLIGVLVLIYLSKTEVREYFEGAR
jgi:hypothetical protein